MQLQSANNTPNLFIGSAEDNNRPKQQQRLTENVGSNINKQTNAMFSLPGSSTLIYSYLQAGIHGNHTVRVMPKSNIGNSD